MPDLFSPFTLKGVTLRNRIAMSPMTMYRAVEGRVGDFHVMLMGSRAAGGFGLVFPEQIAITPDGRTCTSCAGLWDDNQIEALSRVTAIIKDMGAVPAIQLGHTGRKGSETKPWQGKIQLPPDHPDGWQVSAPSAIPYGGRYTYPVHALTVEEIRAIHRAYAEVARRALAAGFEWLEMHFDQYDSNAMTLLQALNEAQRRAIAVMGSNALDLQEIKERAARLTKVAILRGDHEMSNELDTTWWALERYSIAIELAASERAYHRHLQGDPMEATACT